MMKVLLFCIVVGAIAVPMVWGAAFGKEIPRCTSATSSIDSDGNQKTIWYPKGCYHGK